MIQETTTDTAKTMWLNGIFMMGDIKNRNGRVYPINEIASAVDAATSKIKETNGIFGELDHPNSLTVTAGPLAPVASLSPG